MCIYHVKIIWFSFVDAASGFNSCYWSYHEGCCVSWVFFLSFHTVCFERVFPEDEAEWPCQIGGNSSQRLLNTHCGTVSATAWCLNHLSSCPPDALERFWRNITILESPKAWPPWKPYRPQPSGTRAPTAHTHHLAHSRATSWKIAVTYCHNLSS